MMQKGNELVLISLSNKVNNLLILHSNYLVQQTLSGLIPTLLVFLLKQVAVTNKIVLYSDVFTVVMVLFSQEFIRNIFFREKYTHCSEKCTNLSVNIFMGTIASVESSFKEMRSHTVYGLSGITGTWFL